jgi:hypothetical protein
VIRSAPAPHPPARRNLLALASIPLSLVFPLGVICELLGSGVIYQNVVAFTTVWLLVGAALVLAGLPATALALVAGHVALKRADRRPFQQPMRGVARIGLALGYASLVAFLGLAGLVVWVVVHGIHMHLVY